MNITEIARGILNTTKAKFGVPDPKVETLAEKRLEVCLGSCKEYYEDKLGKRCNHCGCVLAFLTRSNKQCVKGKWEHLTIE